MSVPLRKDDVVEENLTTADIAQGKRPTNEDGRGVDHRPRLLDDRPVLAERPKGEASQPSETGVKTIESKPADTAAGSEVRITTDNAPLFPNSELEELRNRWNGVQTAFVDEPRRAVEQADGLVASAMKRLAEVFAEERSKLEHQWDRGDNVSTEDLRIALQRYRSFFQRLLSI